MKIRISILLLLILFIGCKQKAPMKHNFTNDTSDEDKVLITRKIDFSDNVIPSSNSIMARNLFKLSHYYVNATYLKKSFTMLRYITNKLENYPPAYSNWMQLANDMSSDFYEVVVTGEKAIEQIKKINKKYIPNKIIAGSRERSTLPLLENRYEKGKTWLYLCVNNTCKSPTEDIRQVLKQINNNQ